MFREFKGFVRTIMNRLTSHTNPLEQRFADIFFATGFMFGIIAFIANLSIGMSFLFNIPSLFTAAACAVLATCYRSNIFIAIRGMLLYVAFFYFPYMFLITGGSLSSMPMFFVMLVVYLAIAFHGRARICIIAAVIAFNIALFLFGYFCPQFIIPYNDELSRVVDYCVSFTMAAMITAVIGASTVDFYESERSHVVELVRQLEAKNRELLELTNHDSLTGIFNRRYFLEVLQEEILTHRENDLEMCVLMMDLDRFKKINDTYGHSTGDEILKLFVTSVKECLRRHDVLARYGGEEFVVLLPVCSLKDGASIAERIRRDVETLRYRRSVRITVSIGLAALSYGDTACDLIDRADKNLYTAKKNGRNQVVSQPENFLGERDEQAIP